MNKNIWIIIGLLVIVGLGVYILYRPATNPVETPKEMEGAMDGSMPSANHVMPPAPSGTQLVEIKGFSFSAPELRIVPGTKVTWTNRDSAPHTVTSDAGFFNSKTLLKGQSFSYVFNQKGTFDYHCAIHTYMKGKILVQ